MKHFNALSALFPKPDIDALRLEAEQKLIDRDPNTIVSYASESNTLLPGIVIVKTADNNAYYATTESLATLKSDPVLTAKRELSSLSLVDESEVPAIKDRLVPYLSSILNSVSGVGSNSYSEVSIYMESQKELAELSYRRLRGSEVGFKQAASEFNRALEAVGYFDNYENDSSQAYDISSGPSMM